MKLIWLLIVLLILIFIILLIIFTKLTVNFQYYHHNDNDDLKIDLKIWFGLIKYKVKVPLIKIDDNSPSVVVKGNAGVGNSADQSTDYQAKQFSPDDVITSLRNTKELLIHVIGMHVIVRKFLAKISVKKFEWHSMIGLGDAAYTGMSAGALWTVKGSIVGILSHFLKLKKLPELSVTPHFQFAIIQTQISCIIQFRIGYAILAGLKLIKFWKGGRPNLKMNTANSKEKSKSV